jgi:16S rRNA (guanine527-N7)-methyltransferase
VETARIAALLEPFLRTASRERITLTQAQLGKISTHLDLLLKWNQRMNLTGVRDPDTIVTRHFGESLFTAITLFGATPAGAPRAIDVGSGAGFPGLPMKIYAPGLRLTLIESSQKKSAFLKEAIRANTFTELDVFTGRAERYESRAEVVTLRAVERFDSVLPIAARLVERQGRLALLIGAPQIERVHLLVPGFRWDSPIPIPHSTIRRILLGTNQAS